jgi:lysozyme
MASSFVPRLVFALVSLMLAGCGTVPLETAEPMGRGHPFTTLTHTTGTSAHQVHGIDISKWQGTIDWPAARAGGVAFVFIKATEGGDLLDSRFHENWEGARRAGIPRGAYHFTYWCRPMAEQVAWFKRNVPNDPDALPPVLDVEWNFQSPTCPRRVSKELALSKMREFLVEMERHTGKRPIIYADIKFHREILANGEFAEYPYWVRSVRDMPQERYPGRRWSFWQYTATGRVPGVNGPVDRNAFAGTRGQWEALVASNFRGGSPQAASPVRAPEPAIANPGPTPTVTVDPPEPVADPRASAPSPAEPAPTAQTPSATAAPSATLPAVPSAPMVAVPVPRPRI